MAKASKRLFICLDNFGYEVSLERRPQNFFTEKPASCTLEKSSAAELSNYDWLGQIFAESPLP
jgi:hypothetical protein